MKCYREGGCGPYESLSCSECPASKESYAHWLVREMKDCGADGVDFVPLFSSETIYATYTLAEVMEMVNSHSLCVPKSNRRYWKGTKKRREYLDKRETLLDPSEAYLVHVDISQDFSRRHIHAALYSEDGKFGVIRTSTAPEMVDQLCNRAEAFGDRLVYIIDHRNYGIYYADMLKSRGVNVRQPKEYRIEAWLPLEDRR